MLNGQQNNFNAPHSQATSNPGGFPLHGGNMQGLQYNMQNMPGRNPAMGGIPSSAPPPTQNRFAPGGGMPGGLQQQGPHGSMGARNVGMANQQFVNSMNGMGGTSAGVPGMGLNPAMGQAGGAGRPMDRTGSGGTLVGSMGTGAMGGLQRSQSAAANGVGGMNGGRAMGGMNMGGFGGAPGMGGPPRPGAMQHGMGAGSGPDLLAMLNKQGGGSGGALQGFAGAQGNLGSNNNLGGLGGVGLGGGMHSDGGDQTPFDLSEFPSLGGPSRGAPHLNGGPGPGGPGSSPFGGGMDNMPQDGYGGVIGLQKQHHPEFTIQNEDFPALPGAGPGGGGGGGGGKGPSDQDRGGEPQGPDGQMGPPGQFPPPVSGGRPNFPPGAGGPQLGSGKGGGGGQGNLMGSGSGDMPALGPDLSGGLGVGGGGLGGGGQGAFGGSDDGYGGGLGRGGLGGYPPLQAQGSAGSPGIPQPQPGSGGGFDQGPPGTAGVPQGLGGPGPGPGPGLQPPSRSGTPGLSGQMPGGAGAQGPGGMAAPGGPQPPKPAGSPDRFGLLGLLSVIRMSNPDLTTLALGTDLTTLGLNLNSPESLFKTFGSPWADTPMRPKLELMLPACYSQPQVGRCHPAVFQKFQQETLFYVFYSMPGDEAQVYAADELVARGWGFHKELKAWLMRVANTEPLVKTDRGERGSFWVFDVSQWERVRKDNFNLQYDQLEVRPQVPRTAPPGPGQGATGLGPGVPGPGGAVGGPGGPGVGVGPSSG